MKRTTNKFKLTSISVLILLGKLSHAAPPSSTTLPTGGVASNNNITFATSGNVLTVTVPNTVTTSRNTVNWTDFSIGSSARLVVTQPSTSILLNNVAVGAPISQIYGRIESAGGVWIVNPEGLVFGPGSVVSVGSLLTSL